jgi:aryl-alcohol dehydrogenase-like predicted oxidoreductase
MNKRTLGRTGLEVSEIGYGSWELEKQVGLEQTTRNH